MAKYHVKKDGTPGVCHAQEGNCPLGDSSQHFSSKAEAQEYADKKNEIEVKNKEYLEKLTNDDFNDWQSEEILKGIRQGVDVSLYAKPEFGGHEMKKIREGLGKGLDVSVYAKPEFDSLEMGVISDGLEKGLDVSVYAKPEFDAGQMRQIYYGLDQGLDVSVYAKPEFHPDQMDEIRDGIKDGVDVSVYAKPEFNYLQMRQIKYGMDYNVDVSVYANPKYNSEQMKTIRFGLDQGLDVSTYADPNIKEEEMKRIADELHEQKLNAIYEERKKQNKFKDILNKNNFQSGYVKIDTNNYNLNSDKNPLYNQILKDLGEKPIFNQDKEYSKKEIYAKSMEEAIKERSNPDLEFEFSYKNDNNEEVKLDEALKSKNFTGVASSITIRDKETGYVSFMTPNNQSFNENSNILNNMENSIDDYYKSTISSYREDIGMSEYFGYLPENKDEYFEDVNNANKLYKKLNLPIEGDLIRKEDAENYYKLFHEN